MSARIPTADRGPEPAYDVTLPESPEIRVRARRPIERRPGGTGLTAADYCYSATRAEVIWEGWPEQLRAAGIITEAMLIPPGKGHRHRDANGRNVRIARRWKVKANQPREFLTVWRVLEISELPQWPAAVEALAAIDSWNTWKDPEGQARYRHTARPALRLVVDNTR